MKQVNIHQAKTQFSKLIDKVSKGDEVIIAKAGRPVAKLVAFTPPKRKLGAPGSLRGKVWMAEGFDVPADDLFDALSDSAGA
jgi:prevent-host-death family protein